MEKMNKPTGRRPLPKLSKSSFNAGLQCLRRLYLESFHRELVPPVDEAQQAVFDAGTRIGALARDLYPGGTLLQQDHLHINDAIAETKRILAGPPVPAIYEGGFLFDDVRVRVDILPRTVRGRHDLVEVKSTTSVKEEHIPDVAIQLYVLEGAGVQVGRACLAHLNRDYVYPGGDYDVSQLFAVEDITGRVREYLPGIPAALKEMRLALSGPQPPEIKPGRHCSSPHDCPLTDYCREGRTEHPVVQLPRASQSLLALLEAAGIEDIRDIDAGFAGLNQLQRRVRDCVVSNRVYLNPAIRRELAGLEYPVHFLDFESFNPALPLYAGTRPYQVIPFQWSDHVMGPGGKMTHREFLHDGSGDPREPLARSLLKTLGRSGSIVVYSGFEETRIRELSEALPHLAQDLLALLDGRIVDLHPLVRDNCYHPDFHGSFSLKAVLPALVPDLGYDDLDITDGQEASLAYAEMIDPATPDRRRQEIGADLLSYCGRDTEAMVRLVETLRGT
jgi:CRISPR/Cas system-associated exonuclease Cas4 (RecB family)